MIIATAGHVDHGKTALVTALTGIDTDRLVEEKQRGLTIDLGFAYIKSRHTQNIPIKSTAIKNTAIEKNVHLGFVDVPGHSRFISNMLAGVPAVAHALLVVALDDGVMPQTIEHLEILQLLHISQGSIVLTKTDRCDPRGLARVRHQVKQLVAGTFLQQAAIYPVSALTGEGIEPLLLALETAAEELHTQQNRAAQHVEKGCFRLAIDRSFTIKGTGLVVTGSVFSGSVQQGEAVYLMPANLALRVRGIHTQNQPATSARAGDRAALNITGNALKSTELHRGNWLTTNPSAATARVDALLRLTTSEQKPLAHWTPVHLHAAANHVTARLAMLESGKLAPGERGLVQLQLNEPINLCTGDRLIIRDQSATRTLGGGIVLDPWSPQRGRAKPPRLAYLRSLAATLAVDAADVSGAVYSILQYYDRGRSAQELAGMLNLRADEWAQCLDTPEDSSEDKQAGAPEDTPEDSSEEKQEDTPEDSSEDSSEGKQALVQLEDGSVHLAEHLVRHAHGLEAALSIWHESHPEQSGLGFKQIHQTLVPHWSETLLRHVVTQLLKEQKLTRVGSLWRHSAHQLQLSAPERTLWQKIEPLLLASPTKPPVLHDLAAHCGMPPKAVEQVLQRLVQLGRVVHPIKNRYFLPSALEELQSLVKQTAEPEGSFRVQEFRDAAGIGRNLSIEILEYFDRQGITRRLGDQRELVKKSVKKPLASSDG